LEAAGNQVQEQILVAPGRALQIQVDQSPDQYQPLLSSFAEKSASLHRVAQTLVVPVLEPSLALQNLAARALVLQNLAARDPLVLHNLA